MWSWRGDVVLETELDSGAVKPAGELAMATTEKH
jgi:hypothetical protein